MAQMGLRYSASGIINAYRNNIKDMGMGRYGDHDIADHYSDCGIPWGNPLYK